MTVYNSTFQYIFMFTDSQEFLFTRVAVCWLFDLLFSSFICDNCLKKSGKARKENKFSAKSKLCVKVKQAVKNLVLVLILNVFVFVKGCSLHGWGHTLRTEWISTWKGRTIQRLVKCLYEWWPVLTKLWRLSLAWSLGKVLTCCYSVKSRLKRTFDKSGILLTIYFRLD